MNEIDPDLGSRIDRLFDELMQVDTSEAATMASILLACRAALRDGRLNDVERTLWWFHEAYQKVRPLRSEVPANN